MLARTHFLNHGLLLAAALCSADSALGQIREAPRPEARGVVKSIDAGSITILSGEGRDAAGEKTFTLAKNVELAIGTVGTGRFGLFKEGKLADLSAGSRVLLTLAADQKTVESILADGPTVRGQIKSVDAGKGILTLTVLGLQRDSSGEEKALVVAPDAEIAVDDGRGRRFSLKEAQLADLTQGSLVTASMSIDGKVVQSVVAEGPTVQGAIKAIDAGKKALTIVTPPGRVEPEERTLTVANNALVLVDDGKGKRLSLKETKLENIPVGSAVSLRLSPDQSLVMTVRGEGPTMFGLLKAVDAAKGVVVLALPRGRGDAPEEKTLAVAKDARVQMNGVETPLANLKVGDDSFVQMRLSLDQSSVQSIIARTQPR